MNPEKEDFYQKASDLYQKTFGLFLELLKSEGDRGAVLTASAFIEHRLSEIMKERFPQQEKNDNDHIFGSYGVLSNFDAKLKFAYRFHVLTKEEMSFFDGFRKNIRNPFAHTFMVMDIESLRDKFIGILQSFSSLNCEVKSFVAESGMKFYEIPARQLFNITMAFIMADMSFFGFGSKFFNVKVNQ